MNNIISLTWKISIGTGKTSTARKMGQFYYDMGLLASTEVIEVSATELVGQYIGHTGPKTQKMLERGLGKVLFIDEAYRLAEGHFAKEAMDELVDCITKPRFAKKLIIILAGYDDDVNRLMSTNPGLTSRFPDSLQFEPLSPRDSIHLLVGLLERNEEDIFSKSGVKFDITCLYQSDSDLNRMLTDRFDTLSKTASWANARDVETLVKAILRRTIKKLDTSSGSNLVLSRDTIIEELQGMITERLSRESVQGKRFPVGLNLQKLPLQTQSPNPPAWNMENPSPKRNMKSDDKVAPVQGRSDQQSPTPGRDAGVTDEDWNQLEKYKEAAKQTEEQYSHTIEKEEEQQRELQRLKDEENRAARATEEAKRQQNEELRKRLEQKSLQIEMERRRQEAIARELQIKRQALAEARRKEQAVQVKLRSMGVCVQGYHWIKHPGGYRCKGGSHWISDAQLQ